MTSEACGEKLFWLLASTSTLAAIWDNEDDDVYEQLLTDEDQRAIKDSEIDG